MLRLAGVPRGRRGADFAVAAGFSGGTGGRGLRVSGSLLLMPPV